MLCMCVNLLQEIKTFRKKIKCIESGNVRIWLGCGVVANTKLQSIILKVNMW